jgi:hypothetical protein
VYRGNLIERALLDAVTTTLLAGTVLQTQIEYVTVPPGLVFELCCTSWPVTQIAPGLCDLLGDGDGLVDFDGDGLGERDLDGLGLVLADGLGLLDWLGLDDPVGLCDGLVDGLELFEGLALGDGLEVAGIASRCADSAAAEPCPHGDLVGAAVEARTGATAIPDARNEPAAMATATRPARTIPTGIVSVRSSRRP